jgi:hypothetical protein
LEDLFVLNAFILESWRKLYPYVVPIRQILVTQPPVTSISNFNVSFLFVNILDARGAGGAKHMGGMKAHCSWSLNAKSLVLFS